MYDRMSNIGSFRLVCVVCRGLSKAYLNKLYIIFQGNHNSMYVHTMNEKTAFSKFNCITWVHP